MNEMQSLHQITSKQHLVKADLWTVGAADEGNALGGDGGDLKIFGDEHERDLRQDPRAVYIHTTVDSDDAIAPDTIRSIQRAAYGEAVKIVSGTRVSTTEKPLVICYDSSYFWGPTPGLAAGGNGKKSKDQGRRQMKTKKAGSIGYFSYETTDRCMAPGFSVVGVGAPEVTGILPGEVRHAS